METKFQSTFIPRGPMTSTTPGVQGEKSKHGSFLGFVAFLIFVLSLVASAGVYGYEKYLTSRLGSMAEDLAAARQSLEADAIHEVLRLNTRLKSTETILDNHAVISPIFDFLEENTVSNVRFNSFKYTHTETGLTLGLRGEARGYNSLALQAERLSQSKYIRNPIFSDLSLDQSGNVIFSFTADVDSSLVSYKDNLQIIPAAPAATSAATGTAPLSATSTTPR